MAFSAKLYDLPIQICAFTQPTVRAKLRNVMIRVGPCRFSASTLALSPDTM